MRQKIGGIILGILIVFLAIISISHGLYAVDLEDRLILLSTVTFRAIDLSNKAIAIAFEWKKLCFKLNPAKTQELQKELTKKYFFKNENNTKKEMPFFDNSNTKKEAAI